MKIKVLDEALTPEIEWFCSQLAWYSQNSELKYVVRYNQKDRPQDRKEDEREVVVWVSHFTLFALTWLEGKLEFKDLDISRSGSNAVAVIRLKILTAVTTN